MWNRQIFFFYNWYTRKKKFIKNATKGIFEGDVAIIIVPVDKDFEKLFSEEESLKDHIIINLYNGN